MTFAASGNTFTVLSTASRRDAFPDVTQLAPARDTVHVGQHLDARQSNELVIIALPRRFDKAPDTERPLGAPVLVCLAQGIEVGIVRDTAGVQDRPLACQNLPRGNAVFALHVGAGDARCGRAGGVSDRSNLWFRLFHGDCPVLRGTTFQEAPSDRRIVVLFADRLAVSYVDVSGMTSR